MKRNISILLAVAVLVVTVVRARASQAKPSPQVRFCTVPSSFGAFKGANMDTLIFENDKGNMITIVSAEACQAGKFEPVLAVIRN